MKNKDFVRIINEEISEFDYLNNDKYLKEQEEFKLLSDESFQKQFISDSITRMKEKIEQNVLDISIGEIDPDYDETYNNDLRIEYNTEITYKFNEIKEPIKFNLNFGGADNVGYDIHGSAYTDNDPASNDAYISTVYWAEIPVSVFTSDGDEIEFTALEKEPLKVQELFKKAYLQDAVKNATKYDIVEKEKPYNSPQFY